MKINSYPDGTTYVNEITNKPLKFKINSYNDLWHLNQYADAFRSQFGFSPNVLIPNLLEAQADRRFNRGESSGLKLVCEFINNMNLKSVTVFHPHNPELVEGILNNVEIISNEHFIKSVLTRLYYDRLDMELNEGYFHHNAVELHDLVLMSSDAGGFKPLMKLCDKLEWKGETFSASKSRAWDEKNGTKLVQQIDKEDFEGRDILIIDDICVYGGTFKGLANLLKDRNCGKLYLAVSHLTIQNHKADYTVFDYFDKVFTTNSKFDNYFELGGQGQPHVPDNLEVIKLF